MMFDYETCPKAYLHERVWLQPVHDKVLLFPVQTSSYEFDPEWLGLDEVGVAVGLGVAVKHGTVQFHLPLDVQQVRNLQQILA